MKSKTGRGKGRRINKNDAPSPAPSSLSFSLSAEFLHGLFSSSPRSSGSRLTAFWFPLLDMNVCRTNLERGQTVDKMETPPLNAMASQPTHPERRGAHGLLGAASSRKPPWIKWKLDWGVLSPDS